MSTEQRVAVVTGASSGIGGAIANRFVHDGFAVHGVALPDDVLASSATAGGFTPVGVDVRDTRALYAALQDVPADVVVNAAGVLPALQPFHQLDPSNIDLLLDVNLRAALHTTRALLPGMVERGRGDVVLIGSVASRHPTANVAVYAATKAAFNAFADGLRMDLAGTGVRVTVIMPGRVQTNLYNGIFGGSQGAASALYDDVLAIEPETLADVVSSIVALPAHVDVTQIEIVPTMQVYGGSSFTKSR